MSHVRRFASTAALVAGAVLLFAVPAYADTAPAPAITVAVWILIVGRLAVVIVGGLSFRALRRAARRRAAAGTAGLCRRGATTERGVPLGAADDRRRPVRCRDRGSHGAPMEVDATAASAGRAGERVQARRLGGGRTVNRMRIVAVVALVLMAAPALVAASAAADVAPPPSTGPSTLPSSSSTSTSSAALPATPTSSSGGGALAATVGGGIGVAVVAAGSWLVLRSVAARRTGRGTQAAAEAGGGEELD